MTRTRVQRSLLVGMVTLAFLGALTGTLAGCSSRNKAATTPPSEPTSTSASSTQPAAPTTSPAVPTTTPGSQLTTSPAKPPVTVTPKARPASRANVAAYYGLGAWVDIWDARAFKNPEAAIADMAKHGVKTLYVQTGTFRHSAPIEHVPQLQRFIRAAHARGMFVVAWYLPTLKNLNQDYDRIARAIRLRTSDGQRFDSVTLDIESTLVRPISTRNANLAKLSVRLRALVGPTYAMGGSIPSPLGLQKAAQFWSAFPYATVAKYYDVILPMAYYTYHVKGGAKTRTDALGNMTVLRAQPGCSSIPVHLIGGLTNDSTNDEVLQFARVAKQTGCIGTSLYDWVGMKPGMWKALTTGWPPATK